MMASSRAEADDIVALLLSKGASVNETSSSSPLSHLTTHLALLAFPY
jgi:hypothetical protein